MRCFRNRRPPQQGDVVEVYRNVTRGGYSVREAGAARRVLGHVDHCSLYDATFVVQESGRQRVLTTGHKNVHAWIRGQWVNDLRQTADATGDMVMVTYNPKTTRAFITRVVRSKGGIVLGYDVEVKNSRVVYLDQIGCHAWKVNDW